MPGSALSISSTRVLIDHALIPATVHIDTRAGTVSSIGPRTTSADIDAGDHVVMPGLIDAHVHVNEPGRTEWEGFASAGRAAAAGGVTGMVVMPLNCDPVATTVSALRAEAAAARASCMVDFGFWGGVVPGNLDELAPLWHAGVLGFKCFLVHSGIDDFPNVTRRDLEDAMVVLRNLTPGGAVLLAHAEDPGVIAAARGPSDLAHRPSSYAAYLASRPAEAETVAIEWMIDLCRRHRSRIHVVHVAAGGAIPLLDRARREGLPITAETCPHYLSISAGEIADGATAFKCAPPIRDARTREALWMALRSGTLDYIASDHSPCPPAMKSLDAGDFAKAWGGIASLQLTLPVVWTEARKRGLGVPDVAGWLCTAPARLAGLDRKGRIAPGMDADLVIWDPEEEWTIDGAQLLHRHKVTPYHGRTVRGVVRSTFVRGAQVFAADGFSRVAELNGDGLNEEVRGQWLKRTHP